MKRPLAFEEEVGDGDHSLPMARQRLSMKMLSNGKSFQVEHDDDWDDDTFEKEFAAAAYEKEKAK
jgi:hypothetical protein